MRISARSSTYEEIPADLPTRLPNIALKLIEAAVEQDDDAMEAYLEGNEPDVATLKKLIRKGALNQLVRAGAVRFGVQEQGRAAAARRRGRLSAERRSTFPTIKGINPDTEAADSPQDGRRCAVLGLAFKIMNDPFVGTLTFCRIYSGTLVKGTYLNSVKDKKEKRRPHAAHACQQPRGHRRKPMPATSSRWRA
jgi:elongation factor G